MTPSSSLRCEYLVDPLGITERRPRLSWIFEDVALGVSGTHQVAYRVRVATSPERLEYADLWDSGRVESSVTQTTYAGVTLASRIQAWWQVEVETETGETATSAIARWSMGLCEADEWGQAMWIAHPTPDTEERESDPAQPLGPYPIAHLRRSVVISKPVRRAIAYACALGLYELHVDGKPRSEYRLAPEWTEYPHRVQVQAYDLTESLKPGEHHVEALVAEGWYAGCLMLGKRQNRNGYGVCPRFLFRLEVEYEDHTQDVWVSDDSWETTDAGPLRAADLYQGEVVDLRRTTIPDSAWVPVATMPRDARRLVGHADEGIGPVLSRRAERVIEPRPGIFVVDFGQNLVGWCEIELPSGDHEVRLQHGEMLCADGTLYVENLRAAAQTDTIYLADAPTTYSPRFTYHGFRYVQIDGLPTLSPDQIRAHVLRSRAPEISTFRCSSSLLNQIHQNVLWTQRANLFSTPTDCPQRDERLGWMGDILAYAPTAMFHMDLRAFWTKWFADVRDAQRPDGRFTDFAPHGFVGNETFTAALGWADAGVFCPWDAFVFTGDRRYLEEAYGPGCRWAEYLIRQNPDGIVRQGDGHRYGDWLNADTLKSDLGPGHALAPAVYGTMFFFATTRRLAAMAECLQRFDEAARWTAYGDRIRSAFRREFVDAEERVHGENQAAYALAGAFDLVPPRVATAHLRRALSGTGGKITTGFHSTRFVLDLLSRYGHHEEALALALSTEFPSWGYMIQQGATTIWERWDGYVRDRGKSDAERFQDPGMNSFNHWAFGSIGEWIWRHVVGLEPLAEHPGFQRFAFAPRWEGPLTEVEATYQSPSGRIAIAWSKSDTRFEVRLTVPRNSYADVRLPSRDRMTVGPGEHYWDGSLSP